MPSTLSSGTWSITSSQSPSRTSTGWVAFLPNSRAFSATSWLASAIMCLVILAFLNEVSRNCHAKTELKNNTAFRSCDFGKLLHVGSFPIFHNRVAENFQSVFIKDCRSIFPRLPILEAYINTILVSSIPYVTPWRWWWHKIIMFWQVRFCIRLSRIHKFLVPMIKNFSFLLSKSPTAFEPKIPYNLVAETRLRRGEALQFPFWCPRRDSNPHALRHAHLKRACIPIPAPGQKIKLICQQIIADIIMPNKMGAFIKKLKISLASTVGAKLRAMNYTNHCPRCLYSKHVDINPGDRAEQCDGMMEPG